MKNLLPVLLAIVIISVLVVVFFPKRVSGTLCGPVCPTYGLHTYNQQCLGIRMSRQAMDDFHTDCYGIPFGAKQCYGKPYNAIISNNPSVNTPDTVMSCDYPKGDAFLTDYCKMNTKYLIPDGNAENPQWIQCSDVK